MRQSKWSGRHRDGRVDVVGLEHEVAADRTLGVDVGPVGRQRGAVVDTHGLGLLKKPEWQAGREPFLLVERGVVGVDGLLLVLGERRPLRGFWAKGVVP